VIGYLKTLGKRKPLHCGREGNHGLSQRTLGRGMWCKRGGGKKIRGERRKKRKGKESQESKRGRQKAAVERSSVHGGAKILEPTSWVEEDPGRKKITRRKNRCFDNMA